MVVILDKELKEKIEEEVKPQMTEFENQMWDEYKNVLGNGDQNIINNQIQHVSIPKTNHAVLTDQLNNSREGRGIASPVPPISQDVNVEWVADGCGNLIPELVDDIIESSDRELTAEEEDYVIESGMERIREVGEK